MDFRDRHVVVTGGTGALGSAVVGELIERGARCHVPYLLDKEAERFAFRDHVEVELSVLAHRPRSGCTRAVTCVQQP